MIWGMIALKKIIVIMLVLAVAYVGVPLGFGIWNERIGVYGQVTIAEPPRQTTALSSTPTNLITSDTKGKTTTPEESQPKDKASVTSETPAVESASGESGTDVGTASDTSSALANENVQDKNASTGVTTNMPAKENDGSNTDSNIPVDSEKEETADQTQSKPPSDQTVNPSEISTEENAPVESGEQTETSLDAAGDEAADQKQETTSDSEETVTDDTPAGEQAVTDPVAASGEAAA